MTTAPHNPHNRWPQDSLKKNPEKREAKAAKHLRKANRVFFVSLCLSARIADWQSTCRSPTGFGPFFFFIAFCTLLHHAMDSMPWPPWPRQCSEPWPAGVAPNMLYVVADAEGNRHGICRRTPGTRMGHVSLHSLELQDVTGRLRLHHQVRSARPTSPVCWP